MGRLVVFLVYFGLMSLLWRGLGWELLYVWAGALVGWNFGLIDRLLYVYLRRPHEHFSMHVRHLLAQYRLRDVWVLFSKRGNEQGTLWSESVMFVLLWVVLMIYMTSSNTSMFGVSMLLAVGLRTVFLWVTHFGDVAYLSSWYWMLRAPSNKVFVQGVVVVYLLVFALISWWVW